MYHYDAADNIHRPDHLAEFAYKDVGNTEEHLYRLMRGVQDKSIHSAEIRCGVIDWPTYYHLTPQRANIVRPFREHLQRSNILELGAGCGAITRYLGEQGARVTALEGSQARARIIGARCADLPNVRIYCDRIQDFSLDEKFDVVTLIGVLEYAQVYLVDDDPVDALLRHARAFLKPDGILLLAIENQLGLKYFSAAPEDHLGRAMIGINDTYGKDTPITFGRRELTDRLRRGGFATTALYLPFPDYKTPACVIHPAGYDLDHVPADWNLGTLLSGMVAHDSRNASRPTFSLEMAWPLIARNGLAADFANSFLFVCNQGGEIPRLSGHDHILAVHYGSDRPFELGKETRFVVENDVITVHTRRNTADSDEFECEAYEPGLSWFDVLLRIVNRPGWGVDELLDWCTPWKRELEKIAASNPDIGTEPAFSHFATQLPGHYLDAVPANWIIHPDGSAAFIDLEWAIPFPLPLEFIVFRGLFLTLQRVTSCAPPKQEIPLNLGHLTMTLLKHLDIDIAPGDIDNFLILYNNFHNITVGNPEGTFNRATHALEISTLPIRLI
ncbi:MAG: class I SAM-dependent methyltransferase [Azoarcus sp.]|jgi:2-polyprenyl-3-methyl-5-hydroxy-6-metoxy-1,4-benzoquinol methylase|nr:class I SAM-dependent methyltransferase [Azoarcus sp.]